MVQVVLKNENAITVLKKIESNSIGAVVTDPPYNIGFAGHTWDSNNPLFRIWSECFRTLKHGGYLVAFGDHKRFHRTVAELEGIGFVLISGMNWIYPNGTPACQKIGDDHHARVKTSHEQIGLFMKPLLEKTYKKQREMHGNGGLRVSKTVDGVKMTSTVFQYNKPTPSERALGVEHLAVKQVNKRKKSSRALHKTAERANNHPCVKPVALMAHLCHLVGDPSAPILDPFMGSGSTGMAAAWSGFNFIGIELDRGYHDIAKLRVEYALNNLMPSFPLLAPQRKKMAKSEVKGKRGLGPTFQSLV